MAATEVTGVDPSSREVKDAQIASLTGMRGFAALMVVVVHVAGRTEYPWLGFHGYGPIALFVLSGFLLYRPFGRWALGVAPRPKLADFAVRRLLRIFPAYWAVLHLWYFVYPAAVPSSFVTYLKQLTLINTLEFFGLVRGLEQAWSMGTELTWYLALPLLAFGAHSVVTRVRPAQRVKVHVALLLVALPTSVGWLVFVYQGSPWMSANMWLPKYLVCFAFGALVAMMMEAERAGLTTFPRGRRLMANPWLLPSVAVLFVVLGTSGWSGPRVFESLTLSQTFVREGSALGLAGTLLVISVFSGHRAPVVRLLSTRWMQATGRWSYGIYLCHMPLIILLASDRSFPEGLGGVVLWLLWVVPISYLLGAASYAWVEVPTMSLAKRWTNRPAAGGGGRRVAKAGGSEANELNSEGNTTVREGTS